MSFEVTDILLEKIKVHISNEADTVLLTLFEDVHHADVAEILDEVNWDEAVYLVRLLDSETTSEALMERLKKWIPMMR